MYWYEIDRPVGRKVPVRTNNPNPGKPIRAEQQHNSQEPAQTTQPSQPAGGETETDWPALAMRLQADMANFRHRQQRRADEAIAGERERLLQLMLPLADNLARALNQADQGDGALRQGIELTRRELLRTLAAEGVSRLETVGQRFDPEWHEAIAVVPTPHEADTIVEELEAGYKLGEKLLRPARVVVAA